MTTATETQTVAAPAAIAETPVVEPSIAALIKQRAKDATINNPDFRKDAAKVGIGAVVGALVWSALSS